MLLLDLLLLHLHLLLQQLLLLRLLLLLHVLLLLALLHLWLLIDLCAADYIDEGCRRDVSDLKTVIEMPGIEPETHIE